jgi:hypothetical protein
MAGFSCPGFQAGTEPCGRWRVRTPHRADGAGTFNTVGACHRLIIETPMQELSSETRLRSFDSQEHDQKIAACGSS